MIENAVRPFRPAGPLSQVAGRAPFACEGLEPRTLMSVAYSDLAGLVPQPDARSLGDGFFGPVVAVGDIDGDGTTDLLAGNGYASAVAGTGTRPARSGAALISGATGVPIRTHEPVGVERFGWSVAALGDIDGDGVPDYAVGTAGDQINADPVAYAYSGATGDVVHTFGVDLPGTPVSLGLAVGGAGDVNGDGRGDILVSYLDENRTVLYSGVDGTQIREFTNEPSWALAGGKDLDGDGTPDFLMASLEHLTAYSGATGHSLWRIDQPASDVNASVAVDWSLDFNSDGRPDPLVTTNDALTIGGFAQERRRARVYSGLDGSLLLLVTGPEDRGLAGAAAAIDDQNGDGTPDVAATVLHPGPLLGIGAENGVYLYSGADASLLSIIRDQGPATLTGPDFFGVNRRMGLRGSTTSVDLDGDGFREIITAAVFDPMAPVQIATSVRLVAFDGATLGSPAFEAAGASETGAIFGWGHLGASTFVHAGGRTAFLTDLGFALGDRLVHFSIFGDESQLVIEPGGDRTEPIAWFATSRLTGGKTYFIKDAARMTGPAGTYTIDHVVAADGGQVLVQMTRDGDTPTAFVFERIPGGNPADPGRLAYRFDGRATAIFAERVVGISNDDPGVGVLWNFAEPVLIPGFRPVGLYLEQDGTSAPPVIVDGIAQRDGDAFGRVYRFNSTTLEFTALPLIEGGTEWTPVAVSASGDVAGTFLRAGGERSVFLIRSGFTDTAPQMVDLLEGMLIGAPAGLNGATAQVLGLATGRPGFGPSEVYVRYDDPGAGVDRSAALTEVEGSGPYRAPSGAAFAISEDGTVLATRNVAGEIIFYVRAGVAGGGEDWRVIDAASSLRDAVGQPIYGTPHFGPIITWTQPGWTNPFIALGAEDGLILLEPIVDTTGGSGHPTPPYIERYEARNLTGLTPGAAPITQSLTTFLPHTGLRIIAGLTAEGDLAMYGMTGQMVHVPGTVSAWTYANLFDQILRPTGLPEPRFDVATYGDLVSYVTAWGGLNIAGVNADTGDVVVFWHAPGLSGWRYSNLDDSLADPSAATGTSHLSVYLTPWGGINLVGGADLGVYWWAPGLGGEWRFDRLTDVVADGPVLVADTLTSYVTPWGGLNVAGLDQAGTLWVYWWTPTTAWTAETIDAVLAPGDAAVERTGQLRGAVSETGVISIFARSPFGDPLLYSWSPDAPWTLTHLNSIATAGL